MTQSDSFDQETIRVRVVMGGMAIAIAFLVVVLWRLQVSRGGEYESDLDRQSIRRVRLPGVRGEILDRNGVRLAGNRPSYCIAVYLEDLKQYSRHGRAGMAESVYGIIANLAQTTGLRVQLSTNDVALHIKRSSPLPLIAWKDVGERAIAVLAESAAVFPGVEPYIEPVRHYPFSGQTAHVVGYVGRADDRNDDEERYHYYLPEMEGRRGVEKSLDHVLRGRDGGSLIRVDASGFRYDLPGHKRFVREPQAGCDVKLTIDIRIQRMAAAALGEEEGAVVVLDPRSGDVLAMTSTPTFDPNRLAAGISAQAWSTLVGEGAGSPLVNKATGGVYPPGSIFKPVVVVAALEDVPGINASTAFQCPGYFDLGPRAKPLRCWNWQYGGHGLLAMRKAIEQSCNTYFCSIGSRCGYKLIRATALSMGLGARTGIELDTEAAGQLPAAESVRNKGDLANISIGQGALMVTPLQMAQMASTIAMRGHLYPPRLVLGIRETGEESFRLKPPPEGRNLGWSSQTIETLRGGMLDVVHAPTGTGKRALVEGYQIAGKTGTAEFGLKEEGNKRGWMIAFGPFDDPRYAVAMVVDEAVSGGRTVAPRIQELMSGMLNLED